MPFECITYKKKIAVWHNICMHYNGFSFSKFATCINFNCLYLIDVITVLFFLYYFMNLYVTFCIQLSSFIYCPIVWRKKQRASIRKSAYPWLRNRARKSGKRDTPKILKLRSILVMRVNTSRRTSHYHQRSLSEEEVMPEEEGEKRREQRARMNSLEMRNR